MDKCIILLSMIFMHIIADFNLQGILGDLKCKSWWEKNYPDENYKYDYIAALAVHSFAWSFMIHIPLVLYYCGNIENGIYFNFVVQAFAHGLVDHLKANKGVINLCQDQIYHIFQIILTFVIEVIVQFIETGI